MQEYILGAIYSLAHRFSKIIILLFALAAVVLAVFIPRLNISSSYQELIAPDHPEQARYIEYKKEFGASDNVIIVLEGDYSYLKSAAEKFAGKLEDKDSWIKSVFYKTDMKMIMNNLPLYLEMEQLREIQEKTSENRALISGISQVNNLPEMFAFMNRMMSLRSGGSLPEEKEILTGIDFFHGFVTQWKAYMNNPERSKLDVEKLVPVEDARLESLLKREGYLFAKDYSMLFIFVQPSTPSDEMSYLKPLMKNIRDVEQEVFEENPSLKNTISVAYTGMPVHVLTETQTIYSDVGRVGLISIFLVTLILLVGFRSLRKMLIGVIPLLMGIIMALGIFSLTVGTLNVISSSFLAVLFGIGIDFGIYLIRRTEEELGNGMSNEDAVHRAVAISGKGVLTGGLTTGLAFLSIMLSDFAGYSQLGFTAGVGIFIVLITTFLVMPSLLLNFPISPRVYTLAEGDTLRKIQSKRPLAWTLIVLFIASIGFSIYAIRQNRMDYNVLELLPKKTESTVYQKKMEEKSDYKMAFAVVTDPSVEGLKEKIHKLRKLDTVSRIESMTDLIPADQKEKMEIINSLKPVFGSLQVTYEPATYTTVTVSTMISRMIREMETAQEKAFAGGMTEVDKRIMKVLDELYAMEDALRDDPKRVIKGTSSFERAIFSGIQEAVSTMRVWKDISFLEEEDIPESLVGRFKSSQGTYGAYIFPDGSIWDINFLDRFVSDVKKVSLSVTGFPITHQHFVRKAVSAVIKAVIFALIPVILLLAIDFRRIEAVLLSLVPLAVGVLWAQGALYLAGISYNVANIAGLPLLLGLGVVYGVHIVHRWLERRDLSAFVAVHTTGRGVAFSALTTISGLFSIVFARHGGVSTFGFVLLFGISLCLITALFVLPVVIDLIFRRKG